MRLITRIGIALIAFLATIFSFTNPVFALECDGVSTSIIGCDEGSSGIVHVILLIIDIAVIGVGVVSVIGIAVAGVQYLTAAGSVEKTTKSKRRMLEIFIGLMLFATFYGLTRWLLPIDSNFEKELLQIQEEGKKDNAPEDNSTNNSNTGQTDNNNNSDNSTSAINNKPLGNLTSPSDSIPCDPRTTDIGVYQGQTGSKKIAVRLCALNKKGYQIKSSGREEKGMYGIKSSGGYAIVNSRVSGAFAGLANKYFTQNGSVIKASSSFRAHSHQVELYNTMVKGRAAKPGNSKHEIGLAIDFTTGCSYGVGPSQCKKPLSVWLGKNIKEFGLRRPVSTEAWHVQP